LSRRREVCEEEEKCVKKERSMSRRREVCQEGENEVCVEGKKFAMKK